MVVGTIREHELHAELRKNKKSFVTLANEIDESLKIAHRQKNEFAIRKLTSLLDFIMKQTALARCDCCGKIYDAEDDYFLPKAAYDYGYQHLCCQCELNFFRDDDCD